MRLNPELVFTLDDQRPGDFNATLKARGLYSSFEYVLRLSPKVHQQLAGITSDLTTVGNLTFEQIEAFSVYLHETIHWWQHIGSTYGLMLSLSYPVQAHANFHHLRELLPEAGFVKSIRKFVEQHEGPRGPGTLSGLANTILNNQFDLGAFRGLTYNVKAAEAVVRDPLFESIGHSHQIAYGNNVLTLATVADPDFKVLPHPRDWEAPFDELLKNKEQGYYFGSPVELWPIGAREIFEGQACFSQIQYLAFASGGRLGWDDFKTLGMLHGVYLTAFELFLERTGLEWPPSIDHPTLGLFLLICDMSINPGAGFPHPIRLFPHVIGDTDPGRRFIMLATMARLKCPEVLTAIQHYTRDEYKEVTNRLAETVLTESPLKTASVCAGWVAENGPMTPLMEEHRTFDFGRVNTPVRILFSHFLAYMRDKYVHPEFFCWPGAWMAGDRASKAGGALFQEHSALFVDKEDDDGVFPRVLPGRDPGLVQRAFNEFYGGVVLYDLTNQWIVEPGPFTYAYEWLSSSGTRERFKEFADSRFESVYHIAPDSAVLI